MTIKYVYFVQHGIAVTKDIDEKRPLSDIGVEEVRKVAAKLKANGIGIRKIVHSGKLRAYQTASIFSEILGVSDLSEQKGMKPNDAPEELIEQITEDAVMYVGHLPHIENVVSTLVTGNKNNHIVRFQNSAVACVEIDGNECHLKWFITPELCI